jgi:hypothetical protein
MSILPSRTLTRRPHLLRVDEAHHRLASDETGDASITTLGEPVPADAIEAEDGYTTDGVIRVILEDSAERYQQATGTLEMTRRQAARQAKVTDAARRWDDACRQAEEARIQAEAALAYRISDAIGSMRPGIETHDKAGDFLPLGMAIGEVVYVLRDDVGNMQPGILASVRLDRIIGPLGD